ncbi:hypothetical protein FKW77_010805 [Venturia effusa]|uniref:C2H2-type domain-containing protein n=1 Tax=Venturia effusa TaxID=50376 RepID=A0A517KYH6_9PEZI|nr:hypothetical protein FKW77_010805 [Venturia effusa]
MSYFNNNHFATGTNGMTTPPCELCGFTFCQCNQDYDNFFQERTSMGAYMAPSTPTYRSSPYPPPQQLEYPYIRCSPQGAGTFPHYNGPESLQLGPGHDGRVHDSTVVTTFAAGPYAYGLNDEHEARMVQMLDAFNHSFIRANDHLPATNEEVVDPQDDFLLDGTIEPGKLSLPVVVEKVPCPTCGRLLKDQNSVRRHIARQHNPVPHFDCEEFGCTYSTPKRADLGRHARAKHPHEFDPRPYKCSICGTGNNRQDNLRRHESTCLQKALKRDALESFPEI